MKILKFNLDECPEDGTQFYYKLIREAHRMGFEIPEYMLGNNVETFVHKDELFEAFTYTFAEIYFRGGKNYMLSRYGPMCMMTDQEPSPAQKKKALRIKQRRAREEKPE